MGIGLIKFKLQLKKLYFINLCSDVSKIDIKDLLNFLNKFKKSKNKSTAHYINFIFFILKFLAPLILLNYYYIL